MPRLILLLIILTAPFAKAAWPGVEYSSVRAYAYNWKGETGKPIVIKGKINRSVQPPKKGVELTAAQIETVLRVFTAKPQRNWIGVCFYPRHAFVFFDSRKKPIATIEICFHCMSTRTSPDGLSDFPDLRPIARLFASLGLPLGPKDSNATDVMGSYDANERAFKEAKQPRSK